MVSSVFVRGLSRSGGTLLVALLDSHYDISMSYEQYPHLLEIDESFDEIEFIKRLEQAGTIAEAKSMCPNARFGTFVARYPRGGFTHMDFAAHYRRLLKEGLSLKFQAGRFRLMEIGGTEKMTRDRKKIWGMKCLPRHFNPILDLWPESVFVQIVRDGRDVAASQISTLSRDHNIESIAKSWVSSISSFERFQKTNPKKAYTIIYEKLTRNPDVELPKMMDHFGIKFDQAMLSHHEQDLSIHKSNHVSGARVAKGIDSSQIGRWKNDLDKEHAEIFEEVAGEYLAKYNYT